MPLSEVLQDEVMYLEEQAGKLLDSCRKHTVPLKMEARSAAGDGGQYSCTESTTLCSGSRVAVDRMLLGAAPVALQRRAL